MRKIKLPRLRWILAGQFGFAPRVLWNALKELPSYFSNLREFRRHFDGTLLLAPCLHDRHQEGGATKSEYFWQDLLVARWIFAANPTRHVDVGSRVDGFVAHIASFRDIEVFDIRPVSFAGPGIFFKQADLMQRGGSSGIPSNYCDSLSCLHALEHFGLGRYGDPIDAQGYKKGLSNMISMLKPGGTFYLSVPIGFERVEFDALRVFDPIEIIELTKALGMTCQQLTVVTPDALVEQGPLSPNRLVTLSRSEYNLGIFVFIKSLGSQTNENL